MDSRIEELACIIVERCNGNIYTYEGVYNDRSQTYRDIKSHVMAISRLLHEYSANHPEEY